MAETEGQWPERIWLSRHYPCLYRLDQSSTEDVAYVPATRAAPPTPVSTSPLLKKIFEICDLGSAGEFGDADERLRAIRQLIVGENV